MRKKKDIETRLNNISPFDQITKNSINEFKSININKRFICDDILKYNIIPFLEDPLNIPCKYNYEQELFNLGFYRFYIMNIYTDLYDTIYEYIIYYYTIQLKINISEDFISINGRKNFIRGINKKRTKDDSHFYTLLLTSRIDITIKQYMNQINNEIYSKYLHKKQNNKQ